MKNSEESLKKSHIPPNRPSPTSSPPIQSGHLAESDRFDGSTIGLPSQSGQLENEVADFFDRYAAAMDRGDVESAEQILSEEHGIPDDLVTSLHGLYLLGKADGSFGVGETPALPKQLGDFELECEIGRGGMGIVYAARERLLNRRVAVKVLPITAYLDRKQVARFRNEAQSAASLQHPNIVPVYGFGCCDGVYHFSMQLVEGISLADLISRLKETEQASRNPDGNKETDRLALSTDYSVDSQDFIRIIVRIGVDVANAIHFAHDHGIVHRDIKPSNLLLDQSGKIWVADFGLARGLDDAHLTSHGQQLGTARYMSPEQASGLSEQIDVRTDIYSLGVTLYELLTLTCPFDGDGRMEILRAVMHENPTKARILNSAIPFDLETVLIKAMEKDPDARYQTAEELAQDLSNVLADNPINATRLSLIKRLVKSARRHRLKLAIATCLFVAVSIGVLMLSKGFDRQIKRAQQADKKALFTLKESQRLIGNLASLTLAADGDRKIESGSVQARVAEESIDFNTQVLRSVSQSSDPNTFEVAVSHHQLGFSHLRTEKPALAESHYRSAVNVLDKLIKKQASPKNLLELAYVYTLYANMKESIGEFAEATSLIESSIETLKQVDQSTIAAVEFLQIESLILFQLGCVQEGAGNYSASRKTFGQAMELLSSSKEFNVPRLRKIYLEVAQRRGNLNTLENPGKPFPKLVSEEFREAISTYEAAGKPATDLNSMEDRVEQDNQLKLLDLKTKLVKTQIDSKQYVSAFELANENLQYCESRLEAEAGNHIARELIMESELALGIIAFKLRKFDLAITHLEKTLLLLDQLVDRDVANAYYHSSRGTCLHHLSKLSLMLHQYESMFEQLYLAISSQELACEMAPKNLSYPWELSRHKRRLDVFREYVEKNLKPAK